VSDPKLIFVADDDPFMLSLVEKRLRSLGYDVKSFSFGEELLAQIESNPDLIILDYIFQGTDATPVLFGKEILIRIQEKNKAIPVIMLSGQEDGDVVLELARMGIKDYVIKDKYFIDNLLEAIDDIFGKDA